LLVVIAIIAILAALLLPALAKAQYSGKRTVCINNIKQQYLSQVMYSADNDGRFPWRASQIKSGDEVKGHRMKIKVAKNKLAPPFRIAEVDLIYGVGISKMGVLIDLAVNDDIVQKSGTWFSFEKERLGQGRENAIKFLEENPEIADAINLKVRQVHNLDISDTSEESQETADEE